VPGATLRIVEVGPPDAEPVVLLHGGPGASLDYLRPQMDRLADGGRRLVYYDQRGGGQSALAPGTPYAGAATHVDDLERVRADLGVPSLRLVGYSWGALLALLYALDRPAAIARLALLAPAPADAATRGTAQENLRRANARPEVAALRASLDLPSLASTDPARARRARFALAVAGYFADPRRALELTPFLVQGRAEEAVWRSLGDYDLRPRLPSLQGVPSLVVHGREDPIPVENAAAIAAAIGARRVELDHCGHVPYVESPEPLFAALDPFLDGA